MKRSEVNELLRWSQALLKECRYPLPAFANWSMEDWANNAPECADIFKLLLGWDITDFGMGDFARMGAVLFTIRNGVLGRPEIGSPYAEKLILLRNGQRLPNHYHAVKTEDIINRGGGRIFMRLYNRLPNGGVDERSSVSVYSDGITKTVGAGELFYLAPGESARLTPYTYHIFGATDADVIAGEVSSVNDDMTDNYFSEPTSRFPEIDEDEPALRPLVGDYKRFITV